MHLRRSHEALDEHLVVELERALDPVAELGEVLDLAEADRDPSPRGFTIAGKPKLPWSASRSARSARPAA